MNTNQTINVFSLDHYISKYKSRNAYFQISLTIFKLLTLPLSLLIVIDGCRGYIYSEFLSIHGGNSRLNGFLVKNILSYQYNINFSAVSVKCFKDICEFVY